ncbi:MAG: ATP-binding cassette domain-containing protein, partial [Candidatus Subteraquimicrobiales bacterium]|nr:ATP-binding cassette domain-containing protein [Candidatus Subteraquimicrobiales bacterium]
GADKAVIKKADFCVDAGEIHALLGPNGSGKSTLAYTIMGTSGHKPASGQILLEGKDITRRTVVERARMGITLAWQEPVRFEGITVKDYIKVGIRNGDKKLVEKSLTLVGLEPGKFLNRFVDQSLSGGERKRVELAAVVAMEPKLMILDEPDSGLDIIVYDELYEILDSIRKETNASVLLITHREESGGIADRATLVWDGKTCASGSFPEIMHKYCHLARRDGKCRIKPCLTKF